MNIGLKIKKLRQENDMTQEELGEMLGLSSKAVSRWENQTAYPDITLLPIIANIFDVTTDVLLEVDQLKTIEDIKKILEQEKKIRNKGKVKESEKLISNALKKYPNNWDLKSTLLTLYHVQTANNELTDEEYQEKAIKLGNEILDKCTTDEHRYSAINTLVFVYSWQHKYDKARELCNRLPNIYSTQEFVLDSILKGKEKVKHNQKFLYDMIDYFSITIKDISYGKEYGKRVNVLLKYEQLLKLLFEEEDYGFLYSRLSEIYFQCAIDMARLHDKEETYKYIKQALTYAKKYDDIKEKSKYKSILFDMLEYDPSKVLYSNEINECERLVNNINNYKVFDYIRDEDEFKNLVK